MSAIGVPGGRSSGIGVRMREIALPRGRAAWIERGLFASVVGLALALNAWQLSGNGYGNTYYAAAARSMTASWSNFFFGAFDPGGFITVDKPPVFLWIGALSARIFGYSSWSILLPSAVAGAASVGLIWLLVRRSFGVLAATAAGLALALTPIVVAVNRLNLPEPFMVLFLVGAAGCVLRSLESRRWWWWTLAAGALVGVAFNTKMLAGWIPGPAFALAIVVGAAGWRNWRGTALKAALQLALLAAATFAVSASWMLVVDAWPAESRPYIGGSSDNSVYNLVVDYNGLGRVEGEDQFGGGGPRGGAPAARGGVPPGGIPGFGGQTPAGGGQGGAFGGFGGGPGGAGGPGAGPGAANGAGGIIAGTPGLWRMFDEANGPQIAWLLPLALASAIVATWHWRRDPVRRAAAILWLGWVLLFGLVFSYAEGIYHSYYTAALAPGIAALVGIGVATVATLVRRQRAWLIVAAGAVAATAWLQLHLAGRLPTHLENLPTAALTVLGIGGGIALVLVLLRPQARLAMASVPALAAGLLIIPGGWSVYEAGHPSLNTTLPQAGTRQGAAGRSFGSEAFDQGTTSLAAWLEAHRDPGARWDLVVTSAQNASRLVAQYGLSVMPLGGFSGRDATITVDQFADLVASGDVRYVQAGGQGPGGFGGRATGGARAGAAANGTAPRTGRPTRILPADGGVPSGTRPSGTGGSDGSGSPGIGATGRGGTFPGIPGGGLPATAAPAGARSATGTSSTRGADVVMRAVEAACAPVQPTGLPAQASGSLYDCSGKADALRAVK